MRGNSSLARVSWIDEKTFFLSHEPKRCSCKYLYISASEQYSLNISSKGALCIHKSEQVTRYQSRVLSTLSGPTHTRHAQP